MCPAVCLIFALLVLSTPTCTNSDNLALLAGTLKTMQRAACDDEMVSLSCPRSTTISMQKAKYGKASAHGCMAEEDKSAAEVDEDKCLWSNAMQYSLLQTVVEACQKKPQCKFSTKPKPGLVDPCPQARKFVEVEYKCRPYEFRSKTGCEDEVVKLSCSPHSRVVIYDAQYGRTAYDPTCPQSQGVANQTCTAQYTVQTVMQMCHGKRWCQIVANSKMFGTPCKQDSKSYLKVVYACVPLGVLTERFESAAENDEIEGRETERDKGLFDESEDVGENWKEPNMLTPVANPAQQSQNDAKTVPEKVNQKTAAVTPPTIFNKKVPSSPGLSTKTYVYISIAILTLIIIISIAVGVGYYRIWKRDRGSKNGNMFTTDAPNIFSDNLSDLDNDGDVSHISGTFYDPSHPDMILYKDGPGRTTLRAMKPLSTIYPSAGPCMYGNVDYVPSACHSRDMEFVPKMSEPEVMISPKSLRGYSNNQFYYG